MMVPVLGECQGAMLSERKLMIRCTQIADLVEFSGDQVLHFVVQGELWDTGRILGYAVRSNYIRDQRL